MSTITVCSLKLLCNAVHVNMHVCVRTIGLDVVRFESRLIELFVVGGVWWCTWYRATLNQEVGFQLHSKADTWFKMSAPSAPLANSSSMSTPTAHYWRKDEKALYKTVETSEKLTRVINNGPSQLPLNYVCIIVLSLYRPTSSTSEARLTASQS